MLRFSSSIRVVLLSLKLVCLAGVAACPVLGGQAAGEQIYERQCVQCHGKSGEGVAGKYDETLHGDRSLKSLTRYIERRMPEENPEDCAGEEAAQVASYIYDAFYSPQARARSQPVRVELSRLTVRQYLNAAADLVGSFRDGSKVDRRRGLSGQYYNARNFKRDKKVIDRVDPRIEFDFGKGSPASGKIGAEEFSMQWRGSLIAEETGVYEIYLKTGNGARLWLNDLEKPLIDAWVSSGGQVTEHRVAIHLLGGRAYPLTLNFFKFKEKTASVALEWAPPHGVRTVIPERNLALSRVPPTLVVTTAFPPDDRSVGYERGTAVSKSWDQAATHAAIEVAAYVVANLEALAQCKRDAPDREKRLRTFCARFAERAFRRPLSGESKRFFVDSQFNGATDLEIAVKRVVLLVLKSPRFLYPGVGGGDPDDYDVAARMSFGLWDSLPDDELLRAAAGGELRTPEQVKRQARRMLTDARARSKLRDFFQHWLEMDRAVGITKDEEAYPDFDEAVLADLRTSLDLFLEEVVWGGESDYQQILVADYLFLNDRLASFYGLEPVGQPGFRKVKFEGRQRAGILTHPYLLSAFAYHKSSSPIHRGVFLTRNILGRFLKPPPMAIEFMDSRFDPSLTMREKVTELTRPSACQTCHAFINPLGFSLEHFDAVGRYRTTEKEKPIDASGDYTTVGGDIVRLTGARDVAEYAANSEWAQSGFVRQLFQQMVKQPVNAYGPERLRGLRDAFAGSDFNIQTLLVEIVQVAALEGMIGAGGEGEP